MANEFKVKNGLIVTGSAYVSESIYAPNLPPETNPSYFVTWRNSDGRLEVSTAAPGASANTLACWDYVSDTSLLASGKWTTDNGTVGSTTTIIYLHEIDNNSNNLSNTLKSFGIGTVITLYVGNNATTFEITGTKYQTSPTNYYSFNVNYISGNSYSVTGNPEMCLAVAGSVAKNNYCLTFNMSDSLSTTIVTSGDAIFLRTVNNISYTSPFGSVDQYFEAFQQNKVDANNISTATFWQGLNVGGLVQLNWTTKQTVFEITNIGGSATTNSLVYANYISGDFNYTIPNNDRFTICAL